MNKMDYRAKALEYLATELAVEDTGIYPKSINGVQRTEWQDGWNACIMRVTNKAIVISKYIENATEELQDYILSEIVRISVREDAISLWVSCSDLFYWACADGEDFEITDLEDLKQAYIDSPDNGDILWCCRKRGMRPQKPYYRYFNDKDAALFDACGPERDE